MGIVVAVGECVASATGIRPPGRALGCASGFAGHPGRWEAIGCGSAHLAVERTMMNLMGSRRRSASHEIGRMGTLQHRDTALEEVIRERDVLRERLRVLEGGLRQALSRNGLFVIGHARTGTTILENALNDHDQIYILGEADLYSDPGTPDFRERHNAKHRDLRNQDNKGNYCPKLFEGDESWDAYFLALARTYRYVGAKIVINPYSDPRAADQLFDFATLNFYASNFLFTFRNPSDVLGSNQGLAEWSGGPAPSIKVVMRSYLRVMQLYLRMLRNLPHVTAVFHDQVTPATFEAIGKRLGLDLGRSYRYYSGEKAKTYAPSVDDSGDRALLDRVTHYYELLKQQSVAGYDLLQIDQNLDNLDPSHPTPLGQMAKEIDFILGSLAGAA
jgi:hypothetical protein